MFQYPNRQNVSITLDKKNMSQGAKCFNTPILYTTVITCHHLLFPALDFTMKLGGNIPSTTERS